VLERQRIDRDEARRRFGPSLVDAHGVDFSDSLAGRRSYKTSTRRRRRRRDHGPEELGDISDNENESLERKLARLKREAEEVKLELQRREQEKVEDGKRADDEDLADGVEALSQMLDGLNPSSRDGETSAEAALSTKLATELKTTTSQLISQQPPPPESSPQPSTLSSFATLSDRLSALETSLGLTTTASASSTPILPTLTSLSSQITTLATTLSPSSLITTKTTTNSTISSASLFPSSTTISLDTLITRVRDLISSTDRLTVSRKAATQAALDLRQARLKAAATAPSSLLAGLAPHHHSSSAATGNSGHLQTNHRSGTINTTRKNPTNEPDSLANLADYAAHQEQTSKITSLYSTLPRIAELSPLLPLTLERLRSLQSIHAGAGAAKRDLEELEKRQREMGEGIEEWKKGLEGLESAVREMEGVVGSNGEVVKGLVGGVEKRLRALENGGKGN
jgi:nuclear migration protein JNM1